MSTFNIRRKIKALAVTLGMFVAAFCVFTAFDKGVKAADVTNAEIIEIYDEGGNYNVYVPKTEVTNGTAIPGTPETCETNYWAANCNSRSAINTKSFTFYVMVPHTIDTGNSEQVWDSTITYFQYAIVKKTGSHVTPFVGSGNTLHLDNTLYPLEISATNWIKMTGAGVGGINVTYNSKYGEFTTDGEYMIYIRYRMEGSDHVAITEGQIGYYTSTTDLGKTVITRAVEGATDKGYNLVATYTDAYNNLPKIERLDWKEGSLDTGDFTSDFLFDNNSNFTKLKPESATDTYAISKNVTYTFYIQDRAGNSVTVTHTVDNIFKEAKIEVAAADLFQNLTANAISVDGNRTVVTSGGVKTYVGLKNVTFTAVVTDEAGNNANASYINWTVTSTGRGAAGTSDSQSGGYTYEWKKTSGVYGVWTIVAKAGSLTIDTEVLTVVPVLEVTPTTSAATYEYGTDPSIDYSYSGWARPISSVNVDSDDILKTKSNTYNWSTMKNVNSDGYTFYATGFSTVENEYVFVYKSVNFKITQRALTVAFKNDSKTYDGQYYNPNASNWTDIQNKYTVTGLVYGETLATLTANFTATEIKDVLAGNYSVKHTALTINGASTHGTTGVNANNAHLNNYSITATAGTYTIYPIKVHAIFKQQSKEYKQSAFEKSIFTTPGNYTITYKNNDNETVSMPAGETVSSFAYKIGYGDPLTYYNDYQPITVGTYKVQAISLVITGGEESNYALTSEDGNFIITKKILTVTFNNKSVDYDGTSHTNTLKDLSYYSFNVTTEQLNEWKAVSGAAITYNITFACHANVTALATCSQITTAKAPSNTDLRYAGIYTIIPVSVENLPSSISTNYDYEHLSVTNGTYTINRIALTITYTSASKVYDGIGVTFGTQGQYVFNGLMTTDPQSGVTKVTYTVDGSDTTQEVVDVKKYTIAPVDAQFTARDSYIITASSNTSGTYEITKRSASIVYNVPAAVTYNNTVYTFSATNLYTITNFVDGEAPTTIKYTAKVGETAFDKVVDAHEYTITPLASSTFGAKFKASNYNVTYTGGTFTITRRQITLVVIETTLPYKNAEYIFTDPSLYQVGSEGLAKDETIISVAYDKKDETNTNAATPQLVGKYTITPTSFEVGGTPNGTAGFNNYNLTGSPTVIEIERVVIYITDCVININTKVYDKTTNLPRGFQMSCSGAAGHVENITVTTGSGSGFDVATVYATRINIVDARLDDNNFEWSEGIDDRSYTATITPRDINLSEMEAKGTKTKAYDGTTTASLTVYYLDYSAVGVGELDYGIISGDDLGLTFTANYESKNVYLAINATGTKTTKVTVTNVDWTNENYTIVGTTRTDSGWAITPVNAKITVNDILDSVYGDKETMTYTFEGFVNNENATAVTNLVTDYVDTVKTGNHLIAGEHTITPSADYVNYGNHTVQFIPGTLKVSPLEIKITYKQNGKDIYNAQNKDKVALFEKATYYVVLPETLPYEESLDGVTTYKLEYKKTGEADSKYAVVDQVYKAGDYRITVQTFTIKGGNAMSANYKLVTTTGTHIVDPITLTITFNSSYAGSTVNYIDDNYDEELHAKDFYTTNLLLPEERTAWANSAVTINYSFVRYIGAVSQTDRYVRNYGLYKITPTGIADTSKVPADIYNNYNVAAMTTEHYTTGEFTINRISVTVEFNAGQYNVYDGRSKDFTDYNATRYSVRTMVNNDLASLTKVSYTVTYPTGKDKIKDAGTYQITPTDVTITPDNTYGDIKQNYIFSYVENTNYVVRQLAITMETSTNAFFTIGGETHRLFDDTTNADNLEITYIPQITNEDGQVEDAAYIRLSFTKAYNNRNVKDANHIMVENIQVLDPNYTISPTSLKFEGYTLDSRTDAKIVTLLDGVETTKSYTYGTEAKVTFVYRNFYYQGRVLTNSAEDQALAAAQVTGLAHDYYPSTDTSLRNVGNHVVVGRSATNTNQNYTFAAANYQSATVVVEKMVLTIEYNGNTSIYNSQAIATTFFTDPTHYTIKGEDPWTTNNTLPYSENVSKVSGYTINGTPLAEVKVVGDYKVLATAVEISGGNGLDTNYRISAVDSDKAFYKVTKQPIVFKFNDDTYAYKAGEYDISSIELYTLTDMTKIAASDKTKVWGLSTGAPTVSYTVARKVGGTAKSDTSIINYGVYTITITGINNLNADIDANYDVSFTTGTLTITQHEITVTFVPDSKIYDGKKVDLSSPTLYTIKVGEVRTNDAEVVDLIGADKLTDIDYTPTTDIVRANTYSIKTTGMTVSSLYEVDNYIFKSGDAKNYVINQRQLVIDDFEITTDLDKVYDGNTSTDVRLSPNVATTGMDTGLIEGDDPKFTHTVAYENKNVLGDGQSVIKVTAAAVANPDYYISSATRDLTGATISKATLDLSRQNIYKKSFDNLTTMFAKSNVEVKTGITSETAEETLKISWIDIPNAFADAKYGPDKVVTIPSASLTLSNGNNGGLASNYQFINMSKALATIEGIKYNISGDNCTININYKTYDGTTEAKDIGFVVTCKGSTYNVANFELTYTSATFDTKNAKGITPTNNITVSGLAIKDATYINDYGFTLTEFTRSFVGFINPLTLNIGNFTTSNEASFTKVYDGSNASNVVLTPVGYVTGDNVGYSQTATYNDEKAAPNKVITISAVLSNMNYCFANSTESIPTYTATRTLTGSITPKALTIVVLLDKANDNTDIAANEIEVEYGTPINVSYDYVDGFIPSENLTTSDLDITGLTNTYNSNTMKNVNLTTGYEIQASGAVSNNYEITYDYAKLTIRHFTVTLTPKARSVHYDDSAVVDMSTINVAYTLDRTLPYSETLQGALTTENNNKFLYDATYKRHVGEYVVLQGTMNDTSNTNYKITYSSTTVKLTVTDTKAPEIKSVTVVDENNVNYTPGSTATAGLTFTVNATDEAYTLDANAYNLRVTLTICRGNVTATTCSSIEVAERTFDKIATSKAAGGINSFVEEDIARNGTYTYVFKVYDSKNNLVETASTVLVRYLAPTFDAITNSATQHNVTFNIEGYESFLNGRTATWRYFFSRTVTKPTETDFNYHGVELSATSGSTYTTFAVTSGTLYASAKTPLGLKGDYRMLLELKVGGETIYYAQPDKFNIYIATQASQAMYLSSNYSLGEGSSYEGAITSNGNTLAVVNTGNEGPSLMAYNNANGQIVTKLDSLGNTIWTIDFGAYGIYANKVIDDNEQTIVIGSAKVVNLAQIGVKYNFNDREVVIVRINEIGEITGVNYVEHTGNDEAAAVAVFGNKFAVVVKTTTGVIVNMYENDMLVWNAVVDGEFNVADIAFDNDVIALVGTSNTASYVVDGKTVAVSNRGEGDAMLITFKPDGTLNQIRTLGSSVEEEFVQVEVYGDYIYVLGNTNATMMYNSYGSSVISTARGESEGFVAIYKKRDIKIYKTTFIGGSGNEFHTSFNVNEHGFVVVGTTDSKEELKVSGVSGNYIKLPEYEGTLTLVYEYDNSLLLNSIGYFQGNGVSISSVEYDADGKLMLMSTGSSLSLMIERKFGLEDIAVAVKGKKGYVSVVGDYSEIVITKDGVVISNNSEFVVDANGNYTVTVTDNSGRMVTKTIEVSSFIAASASVKTSQNSAIYALGLIAGLIVLAYLVLILKNNKKECKRGA